MGQTQANVLQPNIVQRGGLVVAAVAIFLSLIGAVLDVEHFFQIYTFAFLFWLELSLGCLGLLFISILVGAQWTFAIQRIVAAGARTIPLAAILFIGVLIGLGDVYPWAADASSIEGNKATYLNTAFFIVRAIIYFAVWIGCAYGLTTLLYRYDREPDAALWARTQQFAIIGGILYFLTVTFSSFDWVMTLNKEWFSSIYGWLSMARLGLSALVFVILVLAVFWDREPLKRVLNMRVQFDLGALTLVGFMVWAYMNLIEYIIIWSGNDPFKGSWYDQHTAGTWEGFVIVFLLAHAGVFVSLLTPGLKRSREFIIGIAALLFFLRFVEMFWIVMGTQIDNFALRWWDLALPIGMGGLWLFFFAWNLGSQSLLPENNPGLSDAPEPSAVEAFEEDAVDGVN